MYAFLLHVGLETDVAKHLSRTYGDNAEAVAKMAKVTGKRWPIVGKRLVADLPYIEAEVMVVVKFKVVVFPTPIDAKVSNTHDT